MPPESHGPFAEPPAAAPDVASTLIETTLHRAHITVLHPSRIVIVGDGQRLRIDRHGVTRQALTALRLTLPLSAAATIDELLQGTLARWAGQATELCVHELVRSGQRFTRSWHLADVAGAHATLDHVSGRATA